MATTRHLPRSLITLCRRPPIGGRSDHTENPGCEPGPGNPTPTHFPKNTATTRLVRIQTRVFFDAYAIHQYDLEVPDGVSIEDVEAELTDDRANPSLGRRLDCGALLLKREMSDPIDLDTLEETGGREIWEPAQEITPDQIGKFD